MRVRMLTLVFVTVLLLGLLTTTAARAQFVQYTAPGSLGERSEALQAYLKKAVEEARWTIGPLRVDPWATVKDVTYIDNVFGATAGNEVSDVTATAGLGLRAYLRTGPKVIWAAHALPEYVYWADLTQRRRWNGRYGAGMFAYFNRLTIEANVRQSTLQDVVTSELEQQVSSRQTRTNLNTEVEVSSAFAVYADAYLLDVENLVEELDDATARQLTRLDREERVINAGVRWRPRREFTLSLGAEASEVSFNSDGLDRGNAGTAPFLGIEAERGIFFARLNLALRKLEAEPGQEFPTFNDPTGNILLQLNPSERLQGRFYAQSTLVYSLNDDYAYFTDDRFGVGARLEFGRRLAVGAFAEAGALEYVRLNPAAFARQDDLVTVGANVEFQLGRSTRLGLGINRSEFDSNLDLFDRTVTVFQTTVGFGSNAFPW